MWHSSGSDVLFLTRHTDGMVGEIQNYACLKWYSTTVDTIGAQLAVLHRDVTLIQW